jgi:hypothetical protein
MTGEGFRMTKKETIEFMDRLYLGLKEVDINL